jgi:PAS domain S-box-containing protein
MKKLIPPLAVVAICTTVLLIVLSFLDFAGYRWIILGAAVSLFIILNFLLFAFMKLFLTWTHKIDVLSPSPIKSIWQTRNLAAIESQFDNVVRKFDLSAAYIATLGQTGEATHLDESLRHDAIGKAIVKVREEIMQLKSVEQKRSWITQGLARFSEILRKKAEVGEYGQEIISNLVKYLGANQGGLFLEQSDDTEGRYMELISCYAYGKLKMLEKRIPEGQGLIGQCMLEKDIIFLTAIPSNYVSITSGLGEATPRNVVVVPLITNDTFYGAIELASFNVMQPYQIEFLKEVSENIAAEFSSLRSISETRKLLQESEVLTEELKTREDEMRHHMEQLVISQESMERKQLELNSYLSAIDNTIAAAAFDLSGKFLQANEIFLKVMGYALKDLERSDYKSLMCDESASQMMWENLRQGKFFSGEFRMRSQNGRDLWLSGTFNPISTGKGSGDKVMMFAHFITQEKERLNDLHVLVNAFKATLPVVEFNEQFMCKSANEKFMKLFGLTRMSVKTKGIGDLIDSSYHTLFDRIKSEILAKDFSSLILPMTTTAGNVTYEVSVNVSTHPETRTYRIIVLLVKEVYEEKVHILNTVNYDANN